MMCRDPAAAAGAQQQLRSRNLRTLALLAALFLLPLALSFFTYYRTGWRPARHVNHGSLIQPVRPLSGAAAAPLHGRWSLVYLGNGACEAACRHALYVMRQTRLSLNNDMTRVQRVLLASGGCCDREFLEREHPGLMVLDGSTAATVSLLADFPQDNRANTLFIVDPLGNLMMSYDAREDPHGLLADLRKLLKLSHIG